MIFLTLGSITLTSICAPNNIHFTYYPWFQISSNSGTCWQYYIGFWGIWIWY